MVVLHVRGSGQSCEKKLLSVTDSDMPASSASWETWAIIDLTKLYLVWIVSVFDVSGAIFTRIKL